MKGLITLLFAAAIAGIISPCPYCTAGEQIPTSEPSVAQNLIKPMILTLDEFTVNSFRQQGLLIADIDPRDRNQRALDLKCVNGFILVQENNPNPNLQLRKLNRQDSWEKDGVIRFQLKESDIQSLQTCRLAYELAEEDRGRFTKVQFAYQNDLPPASKTEALLTQQAENLNNIRDAEKKAAYELSPALPDYALDDTAVRGSAQRQDFKFPHQQEPISPPVPRNFTKLSEPQWGNRTATGIPNRNSRTELPPPSTRLASHTDDIPAENSLGTKNLPSTTKTALNMAEQKFVNDVSASVATPDASGEKNTSTSQGSSTFFIYVMLLISLGLNVYLVMISRSFYVRYGELATELRETFTANF